MDKRFLNKVVDQIVSETEIDYDKERIYTSSIFSSTFSVLYLSSASLFIHLTPFIRHCKEVYGIKDDNEMEYIWKEFVRTIKDKIKSKGNINESNVGQDKKFLDKIVSQIVRETEIDYDKERIYTSSIFPFYPLNTFLSFIFFRPSSFSDHCKDIYGIKDEQEIKFIWNEYRGIIKNMTTTKENINESNDIDKRFLKKVSDQIVRETEIDYIEERVYPPFNPPYSTFSSLFPLLFSFPSFFYLHCRDVYGLNNEESKYVWKEYKQIIIDKIKDNG